MSSFWTTAVLAAALAISGHAHADGIAAAITPPFPSVELPTPDLAQTASFSDRLDIPTRGLPETEASGFADIVARQANISNFGTACDPSFEVQPRAGAMLDLQVFAPCLPSSIVTITHSGLSFTVPLTMTGHAQVSLPAMRPDAQVAVTLEDGITLQAAAHMPDVADYARVALQWDGADPGELVATAPAVLKGEVFHLGTAVGAQAQVLHVFSRRMDDLDAAGVVRLSVRSDVTVQNCATGHSTKVHRTVPGEPAATYDMQIKGAGCDAIGQSLELKNVLQDLKVAQN